ncbi:MAG: alpha/beta hydrolase fold domain-containing protein [Planctomycetota bacterium]|nr:alpha/beta hydrolase fold domain-containing protein [Planctomycetota bacterium]
MKTVCLKTALLVMLTCCCVKTHAQSRILKQFDRDGDGKISTQEKAALMSRFRQLDRNDDQAVSKEEAAGRWDRLKRLDANGDDRITFQEAQKLLPGSGGKTQRPSSTKGPDGFDDKHVYKEVGGAKLPLYVYNPPGHSPKARVPAIVFFHGGGWKGGSPSAFERQCQHFGKRGMVAITVEYRVTSKYPVKVDDCVEDAKSAMRWVRGNAEKLGVDPSRIASAGGSAGGHLAACTSVVDTHNASSDNVEVSAKPNAMILFNPALMLAADERLTDAEKALVERSLKKRTRGEPQQISPLAHARKKQPPCIIFFGTEDKLMGPAKWYLQDSVAAGNECEMKTYEGEKHGFFNRGEAFDDTLKRSDRFLVQLGWLPKE